MASIGFLLLAGFLSFFLTASGAAAADDPLTTAAAILGSMPATGDAPSAVDLEAVVTHSDASGTIFLRDDTAATFIVSEQRPPTLPAGERVRVEGVVHRGLLINGIRQSRIERLGGGPRPERALTKRPGRKPGDTGMLGAPVQDG